MLSRDQIKTLYDHVGARQDRGARYEDPAVAQLIRHADFEHASAVFEFGCGTGRLAAALLGQHLPQYASYYGVDLSTTMVHLASAKIAPWCDRAVVSQTGGVLQLPARDGSIDRFVSAYVLDLLSTEDIEALLAETRRVLRPDGKLCLASLTYGQTLPTRLVSWGWSQIYACNPARLGGCRPIILRDFLHDGWVLQHAEVIAAVGMSSEVVVAVPRT
ncbi:MAG: class I SAM-dependent methyltransferase [Herpetosiphonaceae bacterium]|nr:class I SAM-dependent methyltransferase [Herpetosiphonaceae bacterium]